MIWSQNVNFITDHKEITNATVAKLNNHYHVFFTNGMMVTWDTYSTHSIYKPLSFHVHSPSEHTFNGEHYDLELHIVHKHVRVNEFAVLAIFFDVENGGSTTNDFISSLRPDLENPVVPEIHLASVMNNLNSDKSYFYSGSLTTPPCSENVNWVIVDDP